MSKYCFSKHISKASQIKAYEKDLEIYRKEHQKCFEALERLDSEIELLECELSDLNDHHSEKIRALKEWEEAIKEAEEAISDLKIECKLTCVYSKTPSKCPKKDKSRCVFRHNQSLTKYLEVNP